MALCFICKSETKDFNHFAVNCPNFREEFEFLWSNLKNKVISSNPLDGSAIASFMSNLTPQRMLQLLLWDLLLPFDNLTKLGLFLPLWGKFVKLGQRSYVNWRPHG